MQFPRPLVPARLIRRYKRFLADVTLADGREVTVSCPNPGAMLGLADPGMDVFLEAHEGTSRKYPHSLELVRADGTLVGINTGRPNGLAVEAIAAGLVPEVPAGAPLRREVKYGASSRIDLLAEPEGAPPIYIEVKNVHLRRSERLAEFPDSVTARGAKHLREMSDMVAQGARALMLYIVQRDDCERFALAGDLDPGYAAAFAEARAAGVEVAVCACRIAPDEIVPVRRLALDV
ncbi:MAG: DNA/RNA nuclease SfsA [Alphaproteobacteria bacterium]|nr:DNA/RNA nuclease SfsA [Alphaproteobacteria bacterium]MDX5368650.1 DNA/RNA nuclease SfsA [Alphaproteobacteria bacterium]MDX5463395.1 DNA/RNA nuclease SfsA [Alphaproteobacteria bacterium]